MASLSSTIDASTSPPQRTKVFCFFFPKKKILALTLLLPLLTAQAQAQPRSGYDDAGPGSRGMQDDDTANPAFLWVRQGEALWSTPTGTAGKACADCHTTLAGAAARAPAYDPTLGRPVTLTQRINLCRTRHQGAAALTSESSELLALSALVGLQSRGLPVAPDPAARAWAQAGEAVFRLRQGQLNLSCAQCHDDLAGGRLGGTPIPQGQANGYPIYRLEWQAMGSLHRRLRACLTGVRAEPYPADSPELLALETYLARRAAGLRVETPAVRP